MFCKNGVPRNFAKFTGKHLCQGFCFSKVAGLRPATLLKKETWHRCFPVDFAKFLRTPFAPKHFRWLLLNVSFSITIWKNCVNVKKTLDQRITYYQCYQFYYFFKMALSNFNTGIFSTLTHLSFFKTKLVSHNIKVRSHCNFLKPFLLCVVKIMERAM